MEFSFAGILEEPRGTCGSAMHSDAAPAVRRLQLWPIRSARPSVLLDRTGKSWNQKAGTQEECPRGWKTPPGCTERETERERDIKKYHYFHVIDHTTGRLFWNQRRGRNNCVPEVGKSLLVVHTQTHRVEREGQYHLSAMMVRKATFFSHRPRGL